MKNEINSQKNKENKIQTSQNKMKKYITVHRMKSKIKKNFPETDKENINTINLKEINETILKRRKIFSNSNLNPHTIQKEKTNNINSNRIHYKKTSIFIYPHEYENYNCNKISKNKKKIFPIIPKNNINMEKKSLGIRHTNSYFSPISKNKRKLNQTITTDYRTNKNLNTNNTTTISKTYSSNDLQKSKNKNIINKNEHIKTFNLNINNNTHSVHRITKDTIFEKKNLNQNWFNTICSNINCLDYKSKKININKRNNNKIENNNTNEYVNESLNTIIIKRNNSALLTFGNTNNDSLNNSLTKENNLINNNILLILKKENECLKNELMKTKEKVDVLENKIENLIYEKNSKINNKLNNKYAKEYNTIKNSKKRMGLKSSKSQTNLKYNNNKIIKVNNNTHRKNLNKK